MGGILHWSQVSNGGGVSLLILIAGVSYTYLKFGVPFGFDALYAAFCCMAHFMEKFLSSAKGWRRQKRGYPKNDV